MKALDHSEPDELRRCDERTRRESDERRYGGLPANANRGLVCLEWLDSRGGEGWLRQDALENAISRCRSVDWIIAKDPVSLTLAGRLGESPAQCCRDLTLRSVTLL